MRRTLAWSGLVACLLGSACASAPQERPRPPGEVAGLELRCAAGEERTPLGTSGDVQIVELWASWCAPCVRALPLWSEAAEREGLEVLAVSIDDEREAPLQFAAKYGIDLPVLWDPFARQLSRQVELPGVVPATVVIDCAGKVRHVHEGFHGRKGMDEVIEQARALQGESTCKPKRPLPRCAP